MSTEFSSVVGGSADLGNLSAARQRFSGLLEKHIADCVPDRTWGPEIVAEVWRELAGRPEEIAGASRLRMQLVAVATDCLVWKLIELVRERDQWAFEKVIEINGSHLRGMIRGVAGAIQDSDIEDIEQEVWLTVWLRPPTRQETSRSLTPFQSWLRRVAQSKAFTYLARRVRGRRPAEEGDLTWLFEHTQGGGMPPQAALVAALHVFCKMDSAMIAQNFGKKTLQDSFDVLQQSKPPTVRFEALSAALKSGAGTKRLEEFCKDSRDSAALVEAVDGWIHGAGTSARHLKMDGAKTTSAVTGHESSCKNELRADPWKAALMREAARIVLSDDREPHETLSYVLNRFLYIKPEEIVAAHSTTTIDRMLQGHPPELNGQFPFISVRDWSDYFDPLRAALERSSPTAKRIGATTFQHHFKSGSPKEQAREITDWVRDVDRRFRSKIHDHEESFLRAIFDDQGLPWDKLVFVFHEVLKVPGDYIPWISRVATEFLTRVFLAAYNREHAPGWRLAEGKLEACVHEFRRALESPVRQLVKDTDRLRSLLRRGARTVGLLTFHDLLSDGSRSEREDELLQWSAAVRLRVLGNLRQQGSGLIYAYVCAGF